MVQKHKGFRAKTRKKLKQKPGYRPAITKFLQEFRKGQNVVIALEPRSHKGMPSPKFKGKVGKIISKRGEGYIVEIVDGGKTKQIISRPEHLRAI